jgi:TolB-like protein/class 3 adenylate cyclase
MKQPVERRLAAILAADVAGYSRLMGADEEGTHERLRTLFREVVDPTIAGHRGRVVKNTGDGVLVEFASVIDAVRCAVEMQRATAERNVAIPPDERIEFRLGINLGDVIAEAGDIFGDGVNVAARLEALAEPSGICVSRVVRDQVRDKLDFSFEDLGEQRVKNIARPVRVYALRPAGTAASPTTSVSSATSSQPLSAAPRMSIVVVPFANLSNDPDQQYFADGITEDLTTDLSRLAGMLVISRNTAFTYQGKRVDTKQIGRELGVRYVLEGSVRRSGRHVRITAQLIDAEVDAHLWAERFDRETADLFALQDEVTSRIAIALNIELVGAAAIRRTEKPDALDYILRARAAATRPPSHANTTAALAPYERALAIDPGCAEAQAWLAAALASRVLNNTTVSAAADMKRAVKLSEQASAASPRTPLAHHAKGQVLRALRRYAEAIPEYEAVLALDRNWVYAFFALGQCKLFTGSIEETIPLTERAIRLSPRDPQLGVWYSQIARVHMLQSRTDEAIIWLEKARNHTPAHSGIRAELASAYALKGDTDRASAELAEARRLSADDRYTSIARLNASGQLWSQGTFFAGLRKAGMPEE